MHCTEHTMSNAEIASMVNASNHLLNLQQKLTLVQQQVPRIPGANPLPSRLDDRFSTLLTRGKKSITPPEAINRFASEMYPISVPPMVNFISGKNSRYIGRDPKVIGDK